MQPITAVPANVSSYLQFLPTIHHSSVFSFSNPTPTFMLRFSSTAYSVLFKSKYPLSSSTVETLLSTVVLQLVAITMDSLSADEERQQCTCTPDFNALVIDQRSYVMAAWRWWLLVLRVTCVVVGCVYLSPFQTFSTCAYLSHK